MKAALLFVIQSPLLKHVTHIHSGVQSELEAIKKELAISKVENASLRIRLKNAELMYQFAAQELIAAKKSALTGDEPLLLSN